MVRSIQGAAGVGVGAGRPITLTLPATSTSSPQLLGHGNKGHITTQKLQQKTAVYIGGKPVTVMSTGSPGAGASSSSTGGNKLVMLPGAAGRKGFVNIFNAGGAQRALTLATRSAPGNNNKTTTVQLKEKDNNAVEAAVTIATMAESAYIDADPMDDIIEQLDGAGDLIKVQESQSNLDDDIDDDDDDDVDNATSTSISAAGSSASAAASASAIGGAQETKAETIDDISGVSSTTDAQKASLQAGDGITESIDTNVSTINQNISHISITFFWLLI